MKYIFNCLSGYVCVRLLYYLAMNKRVYLSYYKALDLSTFLWFIPWVLVE